MHKWVRMLWGGDLLCKYSKKRQRIKRLTSSIKGQLMTLTDISYLNEWHSIKFRGSIVCFFQYSDIISIKEALWFLFYTRYFFSCIRIMYNRIQKNCHNIMSWPFYDHFCHFSSSYIKNLHKTEVLMNILKCQVCLKS